MTRGLECKDLAEMYDMRASGAIAFSDGTAGTIGRVIVKRFAIVKAFGGTIIPDTDDKTIGAGALCRRDHSTRWVCPATHDGRRADGGKRYQTGPLYRIEDPLHRCDLSRSLEYIRRQRILVCP